jgi:hypothetical protein
MFTVITPATSIALLTIAQLRDAAGLDPNDTSQDAKLQLLGDRVALDIATHCNVVSDGLNSPTLLSETVSDTFDDCSRQQELFLSRRFVSAVSSIDENGTVLTTDDFDIDRESGVIWRMFSGRRGWWYSGAAKVTYVAGFVAPPPDLVGAAYDMVKFRISQGARDPLLKALEIEIAGVDRTRNEYWVGSLAGQSASSAIPDIVAGQLGRFRSVSVG